VRRGWRKLRGFRTVGPLESPVKNSTVDVAAVECDHNFDRDPDRGYSSSSHSRAGTLRRLMSLGCWMGMLAA